MDTFNDDVRRVANLLAYEQPTDEFPPMLVTMAKMYLSWEGEKPASEPRPDSESTSGEISAR